MAAPAQIQEQLRQTQQDLREEVDAVREKLAATPIAQRGAELFDEATQLAQEVADSAEQQVERAQEAARQAAGKVRGKPLVLAVVGVTVAVLSSVWFVRRRRRGGSEQADVVPLPVEGDTEPSEVE